MEYDLGFISDSGWRRLERRFGVGMPTALAQECNRGELNCQERWIEDGLPEGDPIRLLELRKMDHSSAFPGHVFSDPFIHTCPKCGQDMNEGLNGT